MSDTVTFHVGYHKTGTTYLQKAIFKSDFGFNPLLSHDEVARLIMDPDRLDFSPNVAREEIRKRTQASPLVPIVSSEMLCGNPYNGSREAADFANRIHEIRPDAKVLITIREQKSSIKSTYLQYINRGGTLPVRRFLQPERELNFYYFSVRRFFYDRFVRHYMDLFGAENVLVVAQEQMNQDLDAVLRSIMTFTGADPSVLERTQMPERVWVSPHEAIAPVLRTINYFRKGAVKPEVALNLGFVANPAFHKASSMSRSPTLRGLLKNRRPVSDAVEEIFGGSFAESNARLQSLIGDRVDLSAYKYEMPPV